MYLENRNKAGDTLHTFDNGTSIQISLILESNCSIHMCIIISSYLFRSFSSSASAWPLLLDFVLFSMVLQQLCFASILFVTQVTVVWLTCDTSNSLGEC